MLDSQALQERAAEVERLVREFDRAEIPEARARAGALVQALMDIHRTGLERVMEILQQSGPAGREITDRLAQDELVSHLLMLYDLHPADLETRVRAMLDRIEPYLKSHGGGLELLSVTDGVVRLRMKEKCSGCASPEQNLKPAIEEALQSFAPDALQLQIEDWERAQDTPIRPETGAGESPAPVEEEEFNGTNR